MLVGISVKAVVIQGTNAHLLARDWTLTWMEKEKKSILLQMVC